MKPPQGLYGRLVAGSQSISTRRLLIFLSGILLLSISALLFIPASLSTSSDSHSIVKFDLPETVSETLRELNPFGVASHKPPAPQTNSTASTESWFSSWKWLNPFSSDIAADEERSVLPPLQERCPIYTFYDSDAKGEDAEVEDKLLLAWRRAYWAQGFKPIILGMGEAKRHGLYRVVRDANKFHPDFEREVMRWLAWSEMGKGVLVDYRVIPMAPWDDHTLTALRRCDFVYATRYEDWGHRLFAGDKPSIDAILKHITSTKLENGTVTIEAATKGAKEDLFHIDPIPKSFADYTPEAVKLKYPKLKFNELPALINSHLHENFLSNYPLGISLLTPYPENLGAMHYPATVLANRLATCPPANPEPLSCPSNKPNCGACKKIAKLAVSKTLTNKTGLFTLGTIPHPYTFTALRYQDINLSTDPEDRSLRFIRRNTERDEWLRGTTPGLALGAGPRVVAVKQAIADLSRSTLLATSDGGFKELDWNFGFALATEEELKLNLPKPDENQKTLLATTHKDAFSSKDGGKKKKLRKIVEAWNLGDTEAWKFAGAVAERGEMERKKWSDAEKAFGRGLSPEEKK